MDQRCPTTTEPTSLIRSWGQCCRRPKVRRNLHICNENTPNIWLVLKKSNILEDVIYNKPIVQCKLRKECFEEGKPQARLRSVDCVLKIMRCSVWQSTQKLSTRVEYWAQYSEYCWVLKTAEYSTFSSTQVIEYWTSGILSSITYHKWDFLLF